VAAAGRAVEGIHEPALVEQDLAGGLRDRPVRERVLDRHAVVDLAARRGADVVALAGKLAQVAQGVGAGGHGLGLQGFDLIVLRGPHLAGHHAAQVLLDRQLVDQVEQAAVVQVDQDAAAVALAVGPDALAVDPRDRQPAAGIRDRARALDQPEGRLRNAAAVVDHEAADDPDRAQAAQVALGLVARGVMSHPHAVEVDAGVEGGLGRLAGLLRQTAGEVLGLALVAQSRDLQAVEALARSGRGRLDLEGGGDRHGLALHGGGEGLLAARQGHGLEVGREAHADLARRLGSQLGLGGRRLGRLGRGRRRRGRRGRLRNGFRDNGGRRGPAGEGEGQQDQDERLLHAVGTFELFMRR
jgi:hypothetical protein